MNEPDAPNPFSDHSNSPNPSTPPLGTTIPATRSGWSIGSLVSSLLAPAFSCVCVPTILLSISGIYCGHKARGEITRSGGSKKGMGMATTGLVLGYLFLVLSVISIPTFIEGIKRARDGEGSVTSVTATQLRDAEILVTSDSNGIANGNTPRAQELAARFSEEMKDARDAFFSQADGLDLTEGRFLTYCELHEGRCLFISQVPKFRKFEDEAKDQLGLIAWNVAQNITQDELEPTDQLGVALRGILQYGQIRIGQYSDQERPSMMTNKDERLQAFFDVEAALGDDVTEDDLNINIDIDLDLGEDDDAAQ